MSHDPSLTSEMSIDPEGVVDLERNSFLAFVAILIATLGLLAIIEPAFTFVPIVALVLGTTVFVLGKRWQISKLSQNIAAAAVILGAFSLGASITQRYFRHQYITSKAISLAEGYMTALSRGDRNLAIKLVGLPQVVNEVDRDIPLSREQQAVRDFLSHTLVQEVISKGSKANWKSTRLLSMVTYEGILESKIGFIDTNMTNQVPLVITVKMEPPGKYSVETKTRWLVSSIDREGSS